MRNTIATEEFEAFFDSVKPKVREKILYSIDVLHELPVISARLVKKLVNTDYYELRIQMDNEYRIILFTMDHDNIMLTDTIYLLNGFVKKSTKDYKNKLQ